MFLDLPAQEDQAPVHPGTDVPGSEPGPLSLPSLQAEHYDQPASHVLAEEVLCIAADDQHGAKLPVFLHVYGGAVAHPVADEYPPSPHAHGHDIPGPAVHHYQTAVHGVPHSVLGVAVHGDAGSVHEGSQVVAGDPVDDDAHRAPDARSYIALPEDVLHHDLLDALRGGALDHVVQLPVVQMAGVYLHPAVDTHEDARETGMVVDIDLHSRFTPTTPRSPSPVPLLSACLFRSSHFFLRNPAPSSNCAAAPHK